MTPKMLNILTRGGELRRGKDRQTKRILSGFSSSRIF